MKILASYIFLAIAVLFFATRADAQLCTGSLGDPVVNITFGTGSNPGAALPAYTTNYIYNATSCPNDGFYTVASSTSGCFGGTWHNLPEDHTPGDVNGYMMLVNASLSPGVFYLDTVKNLCGGTTYEFSAWLMSLLTSSACGFAGIQPDITFSIESVTGNVIQSYNTGSIPNLSSPQWNQYGFYFTMPSAYSDLVLRMTNNAPGGCGNDLALDDITFRPCGPKVGAAFANVNGVNGQVNFCINQNETITLSGNVQAGYNNPSFQWQQSIDSGVTWLDVPGAVNLTYTKTFSTAGSFLYRMEAAEAGNIGIARCRVASNILTIKIDAIPVPHAANSPACLGSSFTLSAKNGDSYQWTGPNGFASAIASPVIPIASLNNTGKYYVLVSTNGGCSKLDSVTVFVSALPLANAGNDITICQGDNTILQASGGIIYNWQAATSLSDTIIANPIASPLITTSYVVTVGNQYFCYASDTVVVAVVQKPIANAGPDKKILEGQSIMLNGTAGGDSSSYYWTPAQFIDNPAILTPVVNPLSDITYTLHVASGDGCGIATDDVFVRVFKKIAVPNAFSPNSDGINDVWNIAYLETYPESETKVFNRYGQTVFYSKGYGKPWDGRLNGKSLPVGTYYYTIDLKNDFPLISGWILIIR